MKKFLRSRIVEPTEQKSGDVIQEKTGTSGIVGNAVTGVDPFVVKSTKALDYR